MNLLRRILFTLAVAAVAGPMAACGGDDGGGLLSAETRKQLDATVEQQLARQDLPGAVVLVSVPGEPDYMAAFGVANRQIPLPRSVHDPFRIASISKTFIGTLVLKLVDDGALALTDTVSKWVPAFPNGTIITIDHLLRMRSGIPDSLDEAFLAEFYADPVAPLTAADMIARSAARAAEFIAPDTVTRYTNVNFVLLAEIAEMVSGKDIRRLLSERIYRPLGMTATVYPVATELGGATRGYLRNPQTGLFEDLTVLDPIAAGGAGAMISTLADLKLYGKRSIDRALAPRAGC
jgi:D-alanyl-D-alanine carboxypeptidase